MGVDVAGSIGGWNVGVNVAGSVGGGCNVGFDVDGSVGGCDVSLVVTGSVGGCKVLLGAPSTPQEEVLLAGPSASQVDAGGPQEPACLTAAAVSVPRIFSGFFFFLLIGYIFFVNEDFSWRYILSFKFVFLLVSEICRSLALCLF